MVYITRFTECYRCYLKCVPNTFGIFDSL